MYQGECHCVIKGDHRIVGHAQEHAIERQDLRPVGFVGACSFVVHRCDRRLELIRTDRAARQRRGDQRDAFGDRFLVPSTAILLIERDELETWVARVGAETAGYFELEWQAGAQVELAYFGLLPGFIGRGLGRELLATAVERAWALRPRRVWVHTCSLDHPSALANYRARGFSVYATEQKLEDLPEGAQRASPGASA